MGDQSIMKIISLVATLVLCPEYLILYNLAYDSEIVCGFPQRQLCFKNVKLRTETKSWLISHHTLILVMIAHRPLFYFKIFFFTHISQVYTCIVLCNQTQQLCNIPFFIKSIIKKKWFRLCQRSLDQFSAEVGDCDLCWNWKFYSDKCF